MRSIRARSIPLVAAALVVVVALAPRTGAGDLNPPPGPVAPSMTSLDQIASMVQGATPRIEGTDCDPLLNVADGFSSYLQLPEIMGDASQSGFENWIEVVNFSLDAGEPMFGPLRVLQEADRSTPKIYDRFGDATILPTLKLHSRTSGGKPIIFLKIELTNARIAKITPRFHARELIVEYVYERVKIIYTPMNQDGSAGMPIEFCWDLVDGMGC